MRGRGAAISGVIVASVALALLAAGSQPAAAAGKELTRYSIVHGCFAMKPAAGGRFVAQTDAGYSATARSKGAAEPFRMQATDLGVYLLYGQARDFMGLANGGSVIVATDPSLLTEWTVTGGGKSFRFANATAGRELAVDAAGRLTSVATGEGDAFRLKRAEGCAKYPEAQINARGKPSTGSPQYGEVKGLLEGHMHGMAFEFLGGRAHCGRPWHKYGAPYALVDCADHEPNGCGAVLENVLYGESPLRCHDTTGWPEFTDWPHHKSLTHESMYYRWLERAWRGGLRIFVNLYVENRVLCDIYPFKKPGYNCNEMDTVLREAQRLRELQDYIDAQSGGPGKGWFRIVRNPFQARRIINKGKLAVVQGMEVSEPFNCRLVPIDRPSAQCTPDGIDFWLDKLHALGVRQLEITNKFDNALTGVAGDGGTFGVAVNAGQFLDVSTTFWDLGPCEDPHYHDNSPGTAVIPDQDQIFGVGLQELLGVLPPLPIYGDPPNCNQRGFSDLGEYAVRGIAEREMIFDPDHMSVLARNQALDLVEKLDYPGIISSHSWSTDDALPRIYKLGGVVTPYAGDSQGFVHKWEDLRAPAVRKKLGRQYFGVGYGADANGFGSQGAPRADAAQNSLEYPFKSFDGKVELDRQVSGERVFDLNSDGVAHYGLYPDWIADLRLLAGNEIVRDMARGAEAYLQMWERTYGVPKVRCRGWKKPALTDRGLGSKLQVGMRPRRALYRAGQPVRRKRTWRWCAGGKHEVVAAFARGHVELVLSDLGRHRPGGLNGADLIASGVWADGTRVYLTRGRRVTHAGAVAPALLADPARLAAKVRRAAR
jgi:microsomal dipeptidase-like Zn-dependent dipeptidase